MSTTSYFICNIHYIMLCRAVGYLNTKGGNDGKTFTSGFLLSMLAHGHAVILNGVKSLGFRLTLGFHVGFVDHFFSIS